MRVWLLSLCILWNACIAVAAQKKGHFHLATVLKIQPGKSTKADVLALLGAPDRHLDLRQASTMSIDSDDWSYLEEPFLSQDRISVEFPFDTNSEVVKAVGWDVRTGEHEQSLDRAKSFFPKAQFQKQKMPDINPHSGQTRYFYKDTKSGVLIIYNKRSSRVESIAWMEPTEVVKRTSYENFRYPDFCMQGHCAHSSAEIERTLAGEK